jgi:hypothetical protein
LGPLLSSLAFFFKAIFSVVFDWSLPGMGGDNGDPRMGDFTITTVQHLTYLAALVNNGTENFFGKTVILGSDIDLSDCASWTPIGSPARPFNGVFNGNGREISHLTIDAPNSDDVGLFGVVGTDGVVRNIKLADARVEGKDVVGGVTGVNFGALSGCEVSGLVRGTGNVGGVAGWNDGKVESCRASGQVEGVRGAGGLVGANSGEVRGCATSAGVRGQENAGALTGFNNGSVSDNTICDSATVNGDATLCTEFSLAVSSAPDEYGGGSVDGFTISTAQHLAYLAALVNNGTDNFSGRTIILGNDIDLSDYPFWTPIGVPTYPFSGVFDGNGHEISHLTINALGIDNIGLFGTIGLGGVVRNVKLSDARVEGRDVVGGVVGINFGALLGCEMSGHVWGMTNVGGVMGWNNSSVEGCRMFGQVEALKYVGGLVGINSGVLRGCAASASVRGRKRAGALVGFNSGSVTDNMVYNSATVNDAPVRGATLVGKRVAPDLVSGNTLPVTEIWGKKKR